MVNQIDILWSDLNKSINYSSEFFWKIQISQKIKNNIKIWDKNDIGRKYIHNFR